MKIKNPLDLIFVPRCAVCNSRMRKAGDGICNECRERYEEAKEKYCDFCGMEARICTCMPHLFLMNGCTDYRKLVFYSSHGEYNAVSGIVYSVKRRHNIPLINFMAKELADIGGIDTENTVVSYVPRSLKAYRKYGYDQGKLLAKAYAANIGVPLCSLFRRNPFHRSKEQKLLNYAQRAANIKGAFLLKRGADVCGKNIILVDDVVTSGSTVGECVSMLYSAGAKNVICRSIAHTYRKNKLKKD